MRKLIIIFILCFITSGCSLIPRLTFDSPNSVPQSIDKTKAKETCKGKVEWDDLGNIKSCSKGYYRYDEGYNKQERRMTIVERVRSFFNAIFGWGIWGLIIICVLFPSMFTLIGTLIGRMIEGSIGITGKALRSIVRGIQNTRKTGKDINDSLSSVTDEDVKKYIAKLKEQEKIK